MDWTFPVAAGTPLQVRLYFANRCTCTSGTGQRVFNVAIDGTTVMNHEDLVSDVGDQVGTMKAFNITSDGTVNIDFSHVTENPLINGIEIVRTDVNPTPPTAADTVSRVTFNGTTASGAVPAPDGGVSWSQARGAFMVGNQVFYGYTDGFLHVRTFDGTTWGPDKKVDPYKDPAWDGVDTHDGTTFDGAYPTFYGQIPNLTGMVYSGGRVYYTLFGDSQPALPLVLPGQRDHRRDQPVAPSTVDFSDADGTFISNNTLYYVTKSNGNLNSVPFSNGAVTGSPTVVSGPGVDGIN